VKPELYTRTLELINELIDGQLSASETEELNVLLRNNPEARDLYLEISSVHVGLERSHGGGLEGVPSSLMLARQFRDSPNGVPPTRQSQFRMSWMAAACAACLVVVVGTVTWMIKPSIQLSSEPSEVTRHIATLILADNCEWASSVEIHEGERLPKQLLTLTRGTAAIRFDGGTEMLFASPASIELRTAESARLTSGEVTVRGKEGFKLSTSACDLIDLGTEFVASVNPTGKTELHVLSGQVAVTSILAQGDRVIKEGNSVQVDPSQGQHFPIEGMNIGFQELLEQTVSKNTASELQTHESFLYPVGNYLPSELTGGIGWSGAWRLRSDAEFAPVHELENPRLVDSSKEIQIKKGTLIPKSEAAEKDGLLHFSPGRHYRLRDLSTPIDMGVDGVTYFSVQFRQNGVQSKKNRVDPPSSSIQSDSFRITFRSSNNYWKESLLFGLKDNENPIVHPFGSGFFESMASVATDAPLLWTGKIIRQKSHEDAIYFRIFTAPEQLQVVEPSTWHISTRGVYMDQSFDVLVLTCIGNVDVEIDEFRIGESWRSVAVWH
jgi:ferric-dicitrate binding protein FerR (iron transport regulator)